MKSDRRFAWGEGLLVAAVLLIVFSMGCIFEAVRQPAALVAEPVHVLSISNKVLDLNSATLEELCTLPGIGEMLAGRILDYRTQSGFFESVDALLQVDGIGEKKLEAIRELICVEPASDDLQGDG